MRAELGINEKRVEKIRHRWRSVLTTYVRETQSSSQGGEFQEIEVDECVVRKHLLGDTVAWQGWLGSKVRGQRESLVLDKRPFANSVSYAKASGLAAPPPLSVSEWQDFAGKHLASQTIVHTDGAQAYCAGVEGVELRRVPIFPKP